MAFNPNQWCEWFKNDAKLRGLGRREGDLLVSASEKFLDTGGDVYFVLKSDVKNDLDKALKYLKDKMSEYCDDFDITQSNTSNKVKEGLSVNKCVRFARLTHPLVQIELFNLVALKSHVSFTFCNKLMYNF